MPWASSRSSVSVTWASSRSSSSMRRRRRRVGVEQLAGQPELDGHRDEVLLGAVVEVALDPAAALVGGGDDAGPGGDELACCAPAARRGSPAGRCRGARCAGRGRAGGRGRRAPGPRSSSKSVSRRATLGDDEPEQITEMGDRGHAQRRAPSRPVEQRRHPHRQPGVARHLGAGGDAALVGAEREARRRAVGHGHGAARRPRRRPVHTSADVSAIVLRSVSASWSSSSSIGTARDIRLANVRSASSGASRSP